MRAVVIAVVLWALPTLLSSCGGGCASSGLCPVSSARGTATASAANVTVAPGTSTRVALSVQLVNLPPDARLVLGTVDAAVAALGPGVVAAFDGGRVQVRWDGVPFTADTASVTVVAAPDAASTGRDVERAYLTSFQTYIKAQTGTDRAGSVTIGILVP